MIPSFFLQYETQAFSDAGVAAQQGMGAVAWRECCLTASCMHAPSSWKGWRSKNGVAAQALVEQERPVDTVPLVFITGASSGIGQALAGRFADAGYRLALVARGTAKIESWARERGLTPGQYQVYSADVAQTDSIVAAGGACIARQGVPDVVIANAGISIGMDSAERGDLDVMARTFATNNVGLAATFHPFLRLMAVRGSGRLVGIASVAGIRGLPGHGAYCASKAGVISYCESLRGELRDSGVKVVTLCPGYVDTPLTRGNRYRMQFLMEAEDFADRAFHSIEQGDSYRVIPWQMGVLAKALRAMPNALFDYALQGRSRKRRQGE